MVAAHNGRGTYGHGITPWFVPDGAEWDRDPHYAGMKRRTRHGVELAGYFYGDGEWGKWNQFPLHLEDFGLVDHDFDYESINWDETEDFNDTDFDWIMPPRCAVRNVEDMFEREHRAHVPLTNSIGPRRETLTQLRWGLSMQQARLLRERRAAIDAEGLRWLRQQAQARR